MAFAWLVAKAAWKPVRVRYKERGIRLHRGQVAISQRDMARDLDRDKAWVERLWKRLRAEAMIKVSSEAGVAVITICNYNDYQADCDTGEAVGEAPHKADARQTQGTEQVREKGKKEISLPDWLPLEAWADFTAARRKMRNVPFEAGAQKRLIAKLDKLRGEGHDPEKLLSKAVERGYRTVFEGDDTKAAKVVAKQSPEEIAAFYDRIGQRDKAEETRRKYGLSVGRIATDIVRHAAST
jgi:hypothetical protein